MTKTKANVNIALIKYWGKKNDEFKLPYQSSLSVTLDQLYTETMINRLPQLKADVLYLNNQLNTGDEYQRVVNFLNFFRQKYQVKDFIEVKSNNHVYTEAGLASSASAFAALAKALSVEFQLNLSDQELSTLARVGSGSASRSIYGDFVVWQTADTHEESFAYQVDQWPEFRVIVVIVDKEKKAVSSSAAMKISTKHPAFQTWLDESRFDLKHALFALKNKDFKTLGEIAERNALLMHRCIEASGTKYLTAQSYELINYIHDLRKVGVLAYVTMDAGANVKILCLEPNVAMITQSLANKYEYLVCQSGGGVTVYD
jgi:diphosphomevalonate decarboxylase